MDGIRFSLIMATYGRDAEVAAYLDSAAAQEIPWTLFEIIVVDQNDRIDLTPTIERFKGRLNVVHVKLREKGTSHARNEGLRIARGDFVAFPDDDCEYYPDTLARVLQCSLDNLDVEIFHGKIIDRKLRKDVMRRWPSESRRIDIHNSYYFGSAIALFVKPYEGMHFDPRLGPGKRFGGYEDVEFVIRNVRAGRKAMYRPEIHVLHPELNRHVLSDKKAFSYGLGFGAICRKHVSIPILLLFSKSIGFHLFHTAKAMVSFDWRGLRSGIVAVSSRVMGFFTFSGSDT